MSCCALLAFTACGDNSPAECGDGIVNSGEQCDDGNTTAGDGCSATCVSECWGYNNFGQLGLGDQTDRGDGPGEMGDACRR